MIKDDKMDNGLFDADEERWKLVSLLMVFGQRTLMTLNFAELFKVT